MQMRGRGAGLLSFNLLFYYSPVSEPHWPTEAQYNSMGGIINLITNGGSDEFHVDTSVYYNGSKLSAPNNYGSGSTEALDQLLNQIAAGTGTLRAQVETLTESLEAAQRELREANEQLAEAARANEGHDEVVTGLRTEVETLRAELDRSNALNASMTARLEDVVRALTTPAGNDESAEG